MVFGKSEISLWLPHKESDLIIGGGSGNGNGESNKSMIYFMLHPLCMHKKTWFTDDLGNLNYKTLHHTEKLITREDFVKIEMGLFAFLSHRNFAHLLANVPLPQEERDELAKRIISVSREIVATMDNRKLILVYIDLVIDTEIYLDESDMRVVQEYESRSVMIPASMSSIQALERVIVIDNGDEVCAICYQEYLAGSAMIRMNCSHEFHEDCITKWLIKSHRCPMCRSPTVSCVFEELFDIVPQSTSITEDGWIC